MRTWRKVFVLLMVMCFVVGFAYGNGQGEESENEGKEGPMLDGAPAPFNGSEPVKVALVRQVTEGEYMQMWRAGAEAQAELLGIDLTVLGKHNDNQAQSNFVYQAINMEVDGIIIDHGLTETMKKPAEDALAAEIPVVAFDVDLQNPEIPQIAQKDPQHGYNVINAVMEDMSGEVKLGYVYVAGILPLDKRNKTIQEVVGKNDDVSIVAQHGTLSSPIAVKNADQAKAILRANPEINAYIATYDEFAKGVYMALDELGMRDKVQLYSVDISTQDIELMTKEGSPWVMTTACNPAAIGAASVRAIAKKIAGENLPSDILIEPTVFRQEKLIEENVQNMDDLRKAYPEFNRSDAATAPWIPMGAGEMF